MIQKKNEDHYGLPIYPQSSIPTRHNIYKLCFQLHNEQRLFYCETTKKMKIANTRIFAKMVI
jgi:hypothetical protein